MRRLLERLVDHLALRGVFPSEHVLCACQHEEAHPADRNRDLSSTPHRISQGKAGKNACGSRFGVQRYCGFLPGGWADEGANVAFGQRVRRREAVHLELDPDPARAVAVIPVPLSSAQASIHP